MTQRIKHESLILYTIGLVILLEYMDVGILNTSLPQIAFSLHVNPVHLKVALTIYLLTFGAFIPAVSWLADRMGLKRLLLIAITGFLLSSIACGLANSLLSLAIARGFQGTFAAFTSPVIQIYIIKLFPERRGEVFAKIAVIFLLGLLLGPLLGGAITTGISWRYIFFVNVPIGLIAIGIISGYFPTFMSKVADKFDWIGFLLLALALSMSLFSLDTITETIVPMHDKLFCFLFSLVLFVLYGLHARRKRRPAVSFVCFKDKTYRLYISLSLAVRVLGMNLGFIGPLYVQTIQHYSALKSGLIVLPAVLAAMTGTRTIKYLVKHFDGRQIYTFTLSLFIISLAGVAYCMQHFNLTWYLFLLFVNGWASSTSMATSGQFSYKTMNKEQMNAAAIISSASSQISRGFAIAAIAMGLLLLAGSPDLAWHTALPATAYSGVLLICAAGLAVVLLILRFFTKPFKLAQ
jgi:MFS family permease